MRNKIDYVYLSIIVARIFYFFNLYNIGIAVTSNINVRDFVLFKSLFAFHDD